VAIGDNIVQTHQGTVNNYFGAVSGEIQTPEGLVKTRPSPVEIIDSISTAKPFDQHRIAENYRGQEVCWRVAFSNISPVESSEWLVSFDDVEKHYIMIFVYISLDRHPKLKIIDRGHLGWIKGRIESVDGLTIKLETDTQIILD